MLNGDGIARRSATKAAELHNSPERHVTAILGDTDARILVMAGIQSARELRCQVARRGELLLEEKCKARATARHNSQPTLPAQHLSKDLTS